MRPPSFFLELFFFGTLLFLDLFCKTVKVGGYLDLSFSEFVGHG